MWFLCIIRFIVGNGFCCVMYRKSMLVALLVSLFMPSMSSNAQDKPFSLPFGTPPGPGTWMLGQQYGNTIGAFNFGRYWYTAGQGLHFGIDFSASCGTPVVA